MTSSRSTEPLPLGTIDLQPLRSSLHPTLRFTINTTVPHHASSSRCRLHLDLSFPDSLFVDRDELRDSLLDSVEWELQPEDIDIERAVKPDARLSHLRISPVYAADPKGDSRATNVHNEMQVKVPLHARYLAPNEEGHELVWLFAGERTGEMRGAWVCGPSNHLAGRGLSWISD
jgi:hypothetical protein